MLFKQQNLILNKSDQAKTEQYFLFQSKMYGIALMLL
jgi:hypothetical protein